MEMIDCIARRALVPGGLALAAGLSLAGAVLHADEPCTSYATGTASSSARGHTAVFLGKSAGQTFVARDTALRSITVWHEPRDAHERVTLRIMRTTPAGVPTGTVLSRSDWLDLKSPSIHYEFDPPLGLPARGRYAFVLQTCGTALGLRYDFSDDLYPEGRFWYSGRSGCGAYVDEPDDARVVDADLIFKIEFCGTGATSASDAPWGQQKERFR